MLVGVAFLPLSFPPSGTQAFYIIKRQNCLNICNTVYFVSNPAFFAVVFYVFPGFIYVCHFFQYVGPHDFQGCNPFSASFYAFISILCRDYFADVLGHGISLAQILFEDPVVLWGLFPIGSWCRLVRGQNLLGIAPPLLLLPVAWLLSSTSGVIA